MSQSVVQLLFQQYGKLLFGFRHNVAVENNKWGFPSGRVESNETPMQAALREAKEELNVTVQQIEWLFSLQDHRGKKHDFFFCRGWLGEIINAEPHLCRELSWFSPAELPLNCTAITYIAIEEYLARSA